MLARPSWAVGGDRGQRTWSGCPQDLLILLLHSRVGIPAERTLAFSSSSLADSLLYLSHVQGGRFLRPVQPHLFVCFNTRELRPRESEYTRTLLLVLLLISCVTVNFE